MTTDLVPKPYALDLPNTYDGKALRQPFSDFLVEGVVGINDFLVVPKGGTAANPDGGGAARNRSVDILALANSAAWVQGDDTPNTQGIYRCLGGAVTINETLNTNTSGQTRIDLVTLKVLDASGKAQTTIVQGTPGAGAPALPADSLMLAQVTCADSFSVIAAAQILDTRIRTVSHVFSVSPAADVNGITGSAWTDIVALPTFTLANDRSVRVEARVKLVNTAAAVSQVALQVIDTSQSNVVVATTGVHKIAVTGGADEAFLTVSETLPLVAGAHTLKLQAWKFNGTVNVIKSETMSTARNVTRLAAVLP